MTTLADDVVQLVAELIMRAARSGDGVRLTERDLPELRTAQREILSGLCRARAGFVLERDLAGVLVLIVLPATRVGLTPRRHLHSPRC